MQKVLVTGANGFVGRELVRALSELEFRPVAATRKKFTGFSDSVDYIEAGDLSPQQDWSQFLHDIDSVIHLAARVHIMGEESTDALDIYRRTNTDSTLNLARHAAQAGVRRFIFLSTVKVNGESTDGRPPFSERDICQPSDPYAISKYEAEIGLRDISKETGMEVVIIRPPLIYGPGVKGNFVRMMNLVSKGVPLPLGAVRNQRSLLAMENLVNFLILSINHPQAANETFLLSDGEDLSTTELIQKLAHAQGKNARLIPIPVKLMRFASVIAGKKDVADRLFGSLQINSDKATQLMNWKPAIDMDGQLRKMSGNIE